MREKDLYGMNGNWKREWEREEGREKEEDERCKRKEKSNHNNDSFKYRNLLSSNINIFIEFVLNKEKGKKRREKSGIPHSTYVYIAEIIKLKIHLSLGDSFAFYEKIRRAKEIQTFCKRTKLFKRNNFSPKRKYSIDDEKA